MSAGLLVVFPLIIFVFVLAGVVVAKGVRAAQREQSDGGENVIKTVYVYVVLFATLMMTIGGTVGAFMAIADLVAPASYYQGFDEYLRSSKEPAGGQTTINIEEAKKQRSNTSNLLLSKRLGPGSGRSTVSSKVLAGL